MSNKIKLGISTMGTLAWLALQASPVWATDGGLSVSQPDLFSITSLGEFVGAIVSLMFLIAGVIVFVFLVWGGVQWITSGGDKGKTQEARDRITAALVGLAIVAIAWAILMLAQAFFGFDIGNIDLPLPY